MLNNNRIIGLSGYAGSGKDLFYHILSSKIKCKRFALADLLKEELHQTIKSLYGVDIFTCSREEKELIRPIMVAHGKVRRTLSNGTYWTGYLKPKIDKYLADNKDGFAVVTDIRYAEYVNDEVIWLKDIMGGKLVHIKKYIQNENGELEYVNAPNQDELENDPKVQKLADYKIEWIHPRASLKETEQDRDIRLSTYVEDFLNSIK